MEFRILGPLDVLEGTRSLQLGGSKQRALLAVLLLHAGEVVSTDRLIDELWGELPPSTAAHTIQVFVSRLRKLLASVDPEPRILTRAPGYLLRVERDELDLHRVERLVRAGREALADGQPERASALLAEAVSLWRGPSLADFAYEPFAQAAVARLDELRLAALEERIEADLAGGRHGELVAELEALVREHPLRERLRGQLMLALYRSGRQADALEAFQQARRVLVEELGIEPSPALQNLERSILRQAPELEPPAREPGAAPRASGVQAPERSILLVSEDEAGLDALIQLAEPLAGAATPHELILARTVPPVEGALAGAAGILNEHRAALSERGIPARAAAFTSSDPGADLARLASKQEVDLILVGVTRAELSGGTVPDACAVLLGEAPCDAALVVGTGPDVSGAVLVPFGGARHDWAALELGAWLAAARGVPLRLLGTEAETQAGRRDASQLLAHAALSVQHLLGVATEPVLAARGAEGLVRAAKAGGLVVLGLGELWRSEGLGRDRTTVVREAGVPVLLVCRGLRPGGLTPSDGLTRFTWSLAGAGT